MVDVELAPKEFRRQVRRGEWTGPTAGCCSGFAQANLVILHSDHAQDFLLFCQRNPRPCPLLEVTSPGEFRSPTLAEDADLRTDLPKYRLDTHGRLKCETSDLRELWRDDLVSFLLGCSFTLEPALSRAAIPLRHVEMGRNVPMYITDLRCHPAGVFAGPLVVSMRPVPQRLVPRAIEVSARFVLAHGAPVHVGDPEEIGIVNLEQPDYGEAVPVRQGEVPVFWACGVTPQAVATRAKLDLLITHAPGHMFVTDLRDEDLAE